MIGEARSALDRYLFAPAGPGPLGACRLVALSLLFAGQVGTDHAVWADVDRAFHMPHGVLHRLGVPVAPAHVLGPLSIVFRAALLTGAIGLFTRTSLAVACMSGAYLLWIPHTFGKIHHHDAIVPFTLGLLAVSRAGDAWSLDAVRRRRAGRAAPSPSGEYRWPIRAVWIVLATVFFSAGLSKLRAAGLAWATSDHLGDVLRKESLKGRPLVDWGPVLAAHPWLTRGLAATTLLLELGQPLALVSQRARRVLVPGMAAALLGFRALMGPAFWPLLAVGVFWIPGLVAGGMSPRRDR